MKYDLKKQMAVSSHIYFNPRVKHLDDIRVIIESDNAFILETVPGDKSMYHQLSKYIHHLVTKSGILCQGLNSDYIKRSFRTSDAIIVLSSKAINILPNGNVFSFALIQFDEVNNFLYIDVICSNSGIKYAGDLLLSSIDRLCKSLLISKIKLKSVSSAITFYEKYGFRKKAAICDPGHLCEMEKVIQRSSKTTSKSKSRSKTSKSNTKTRKSK
jgi:hypothetical protein